MDQFHCFHTDTRRSGRKFYRPFHTGQVTDFVKVDLGFWPFNPFAIFNVADACITVGVFLYLIFTVAEEIRAKRSQKKPEKTQ
ncbi:MAG: signal peptidase II [Candidatus Marinimicrobia bacterium]|nr:signal peptidase II [Candidatus Neomarinimicrobiota bacterium]